jgi:hypothetical protein
LGGGGGVAEAEEEIDADEAELVLSLGYLCHWRWLGQHLVQRKL